MLAANFDFRVFMARLDSAINQSLAQLLEQLLVLLDSARDIEFRIFHQYGETEFSLVAMNELVDVAQKSLDFYNQLSNFRLRIAEAQPEISGDVLALVVDRIELIRNSIPAFERSVLEVKLIWRL
jgi:hypothetical protein